MLDRVMGKDGEALIRWKPLEPADDFPTNFPIEADPCSVRHPDVRDTARAMAQESTTPDLVALMGRAFEAANRRDFDAVASSFAEDATFGGRALGDHFEGRAAIRSFVEDWFGTYEELEFGLEEVRDLGNGVVFAVVVQNGRPTGSAGHLRQREGWVFVWVRGLIARLTIYEVDEARAAAERLAQERG
jgi:uncharacterized protein (TIGR02246 family)